MIHLINTTIDFSGQEILKAVNWHIGPTDRIGLVGNNGSGKSTLMKLICSIQKPDGGSVSKAKNVTMGYLPQDGVVHGDKTLFEEASSVFGEINKMQDEAAIILEKMKHLDGSSKEYHQIANRYGDIQEHLRINDGYQIEKKVEKVLVGLGFGHDDQTRVCSEFSGGWQMRIALAKVLLQEPNILLLDEPTNYLDIEARDFLQNWIANYPHAVLLVSHDRYFLDQVINRITEIHDGHLTDYFCNYSRYTVERKERRERLIVQAERVEAERQRIQAFIDRFRYQAKKAPMVQSRVKQLEKLEKISIPSVRKKINFKFPQPGRSGKMAVEAKGLSTGYGDGVDIFHNVDFMMRRGEKVALTGVNGAGKSTLMKVLAGKLEKRAGEFSLGHNVDLDYFAQEAHKTLDPKATVYETLERSCPFNMIPRLRSLLGTFLFSGDDVDKKVFILSGGEKNRLALARMLLIPSNLLLMDEPTNHLDIDAKQILLEALQKFEGSLLFVSHDRYFLDNLATRVFHLKEGELYNYPGKYKDFLAHLEARGESEGGDSSDEKVAQDVDKIEAKAERINRWKEEKKRQREITRLNKLVKKLEKEISETESTIKTLLEQMANPDLAINFTGLEKLSEEKNHHAKHLEALNTQWEATFEELETLEE